KGQYTDGKSNNSYAALTGRLFGRDLPAALRRAGLCCPCRAEENAQSYRVDVSLTDLLPTGRNWSYEKFLVLFFSQLLSIYVNHR
ncbi:MAG: hypothetical protein LBL62_01450, partial [Planctomycetaceae bacterium]|nr:hypothetical protein [Planctomycetaceae bacterium]